jgi:glycosyltransferase involved in cell wall biosynthesis
MLAIGSANAQFYRAMSVPERRIFPAPYTVDNARFIEASRLASDDHARLRSAFGVDDDRAILLYSAKFQDRKRPADVVRAAAQLNREGATFQLVLVGSGELEKQVRALVAELGVANAHFHGFVNQTALPQIYAACDIFVLPSENEPWGLAINEAMCAGMPIVASSEIGCVPDLVRNGVNGSIFPAGDVSALARALRPLIDDSGKRLTMGAASRDIISRWSYAEVRDGLRAALASVGLGAHTLGAETS